MTPKLPVTEDGLTAETVITIKKKLLNMMVKVLGEKFSIKRRKLKLKVYK